jgi:predicted TIM-barrel fold metal-dependent hydrolase
VETVYNPPSTLATVIKAIGPERMVFASDAPVTNLRLEVEKLDHVPLDAQARTALMGGTIARLLRMPHEVR